MTIAPDPDLARFRDELDRLSPGRCGPLALAVSGGPDSVALLLLAAAALPGGVAAATVDHGLRTGSAGDAAFVAALCRARGIPHATLTVAVAPGGDGLQAAARAARYAALAEWCEGIGADTLATAHHADDQAETLLMRLGRGAGVGGLAGVRAARALTGRVTLVRPLLGWRRDALAATVAAAGIVPVADPANADPRYDRTAARALLSATSGIDPARVAASAAHLAEAEAALAWAAARAWGERAEVGAGVAIDPAGLPREIVRRLMLRAIATLGGPAPDGPALERLCATLAVGGTATLSGLRAEGGPRWRLAPAPARRGN